MMPVIKTAARPILFCKERFNFMMIGSGITKRKRSEAKLTALTPMVKPSILPVFKARLRFHSSSPYGKLKTA